MINLDVLTYDVVLFLRFLMYIEVLHGVVCQTSLQQTYDSMTL